MFSAMHILGYKSILDAKIPLKPLNILSGINSSGKSSFIQCIKMIEGLLHGKTGPLEHLGSLDELLFKKSRPNDDLQAPDHISISAKFDRGDITWFTEVDEQSEDKKKKSSYKTTGAILTETQYIYNFLSAARFGPQPYLPSNPEIRGFYLGENGEYVCDCLDEYKDIPLPPDLQHTDSVGMTLSYNTAAWLSDIVANAQFAVKREQLFDLANMTYNGHRASNVGFGLSYTLPVIAGLLGMPAIAQQQRMQALLVIENPEAHLHPQGQTRLGQLMALSAMSGVQIIVETHSDYIIDGVRLAIKKGVELADGNKEKVPPEDVNFLFFKLNEDNYSNIDIISSNTSGQLDKWPQGFFDQARKNKSLLAGL